MKKTYRLTACALLFVMLFSLFSCAPFKLQGTFNASFSLSECSESEDQYQYEFYGDGQGIEKNTANGVVTAFTYSALNNTITVSTENTSVVYQYSVEEKNDLRFTYQKNGKTESVLLEKK